MSDYDEDFESEYNPTPRVKQTPPVAAARKERPASTASSRRVLADRQTNPPRSSSSLAMRPRVVGASSSMVQLTPEQHATMAELKRANLNLRAQLLDVNRLLDDHLAQRGQRVAQVHAVPKKGGQMPSDRLARKNEQQRRVNAEMTAKLHQANQQAIVNSASNELNELKNNARLYRSENRGLENVYAHQNNQLAVVRRVEQEMKDAKAEHSNELRGWKDEGRASKEVREAEMTAYNRTMRAVERLQEKIRIQDDVGVAVRSVSDMHEQVEERDSIIDALKYQVAVLSKTSVTDKKRAKTSSERIARDLVALRDEVHHLRQQVAGLGMAAELGVDTRC
jgi:hypothetical protein